MELDPLWLSRVQFAFVVSFHAIFPVFTIGLAAWIALLEFLNFRDPDPVRQKLSQFWIKIFALVFGMGVVSGIVMAFQFGTNWSNFSYASSNFMGPVLSYEVVTAFFLEATFLGVLLFGRDRVPRGVHLLAACMVALGTFISSFWILSANSWFHTPAGVELIDGHFHVRSWVEAIFNPSLPYRFAHMALASFITGGFVVAGISSWYLLRGRNPRSSRMALKMTVVMLAVATPLQLVMGDLHGLNTLEHQPVKVAAMEGHWERQRGAPFLLAAIPDQEAATNRLEIGIPKLSALILTHELDGETPGLKDVPADERPPVGLVFWSFRVMLLVGTLMLAVGLVSAVLRWRGRLYDSRPFLRWVLAMGPSGFVAVLAGWIVTEVGRQPFTVYGLLRTAESVAPVDAPAVGASLAAFVLVYFAVFGFGTYYILQMMRQPPDGSGPQAGAPERAAGTTPLAALRPSSLEEGSHA